MKWQKKKKKKKKKKLSAVQTKKGINFHLGFISNNNHHAIFLGGKHFMGSGHGSLIFFVENPCLCAHCHPGYAAPEMKWEKKLCDYSSLL